MVALYLLLLYVRTLIVLKNTKWKESEISIGKWRKIALWCVEHTFFFFVSSLFDSLLFYTFIWFYFPFFDTLLRHCTTYISTLSISYFFVKCGTHKVLCGYKTCYNVSVWCWNLLYVCIYLCDKNCTAGIMHSYNNRICSLFCSCVCVTLCI